MDHYLLGASLFTRYLSVYYMYLLKKMIPPYCLGLLYVHFVHIVDMGGIHKL